MMKLSATLWLCLFSASAQSWILPHLYTFAPTRFFFAPRSGTSNNQDKVAIRLIHPTISDNSAGIVVVVDQNGHEGVICADHWTKENADVVCHQLGLPLGAFEAATEPSVSSEYVYRDVRCKGHEAGLEACEKVSDDACDSGKVAAVKCQTLAAKECGTHEFRCSAQQCVRASFLCDGDDDCDNGEDEDEHRCKEPLAVRLVGGASNVSGRVEVRHHGVWGTICDDSWDDRDAAVVCRMLGFSSATNGKVTGHSGGHFGKGSGLIWLDNLACNGNEKSIEECPKRPWGRSNCDHTEDAGVSCATSAPHKLMRDQLNCGQRSPEANITNPAWLETSRVVGGEPAVPGSHPWQAAIKLKSLHHCGATVISEYFVLSAAHCVAKFPKHMYLIKVGDFLTEEHDLEEEEFTVLDIYKHEQFRHGARMNNDIALIQIKPNEAHGIRFGKRIQPACLPTLDTSYTPGLKCHISGWGQMEFRDHTYPERLQESQVPILPWETCHQPDIYGPLRFTENMFCAGFLEGGIDTCRGDSGGPLVCPVQGRFVLFGVVSWGDGCGMENKPGVYTRVQNYLDWISTKINSAASLQIDHN